MHLQNSVIYLYDAAPDPRTIKLNSLGVKTEQWQLT